MATSVRILGPRVCALSIAPSWAFARSANNTMESQFIARLLDISDIFWADDRVATRIHLAIKGVRVRLCRHSTCWMSKRSGISVHSWKRQDHIAEVAKQSVSLRLASSCQECAIYLIGVTQHTDAYCRYFRAPITRTIVICSPARSHFKELVTTGPCNFPDIPVLQHLGMRSVEPGTG